MVAPANELYALDEPKKIDDAVIGDVFIQQHSDDYAFLWGEWHSYDAQRGIWAASERRIKRDMVDHLKQYRRRKVKVTAARTKQVLEYCESYLPPLDVLPNNRDLIPMRNGCYNVRTGVLHPHSADNYFRYGLNFDYDPEAQCDLWLETLYKILVFPDGSPDTELRNFVQEMMGYAFWGDNRLQAAFFLYGEGGTGKSTLIEVLQSMIPSAMPIDLETFNEYQMATLVDVRLAVISEFEENASFPEAAFKRLLSSDLVQARFAHGKPFKFQPICTVIGAMNSLPRVKDRSRGVFRRVFIVPFNRVITSPDVYLPQKLEAEKAGIFAWAMRGLSRLRARKYFDAPTQVIEAGNEWRFRNDTERQYLTSQYCILAESEFTSTDDLYKWYRVWCKDNGTYPKSQAAVARDWKRLGLQHTKQNDVRGWRGVKLNITINDLSVPF